MLGSYCISIVSSILSAEILCTLSYICTRYVGNYACRLPAFLTNEGTFQNKKSNVRLHGGGGGGTGTRGAVTTS